ncbi:MAG: response regulator [bacterium]|nr:response regulator [bacterium]
MNKVYTPTDVAKICQVSRSTIHNWIDRGSLKAISLPNGYKRITEDELKRFLKEANIPFPKGAENAPAILIVDDEEIIIDLLREIVEEVLKSKGIESFSIETARDGIDASLKIGHLKPDLVFLDVMLPGIQGFDVCKKIRSNRDLDAVKIIIVTGQLDDSLDQKVEEFKLEGIIRKPLNEDAIFRFVAKYF